MTLFEITLKPYSGHIRKCLEDAINLVQTFPDDAKFIFIFNDRRIPIRKDSSVSALHDLYVKGYYDNR
jgi:hypothetical protein